MEWGRGRYEACKAYSKRSACRSDSRFDPIAIPALQNVTSPVTPRSPPHGRDSSTG
jgi:hypothetical protein